MLWISLMWAIQRKGFFVCVWFFFPLIVWQNFERFFTNFNFLPKSACWRRDCWAFNSWQWDLSVFLMGMHSDFSKLMICKKLDLGSGKFGLRKGQGIKRLLWAIKTRWSRTLCSEEELLAGQGTGQVEQSQDQQSNWDFHIKPVWNTLNICFLCNSCSQTDTCAGFSLLASLLFPHLVRNSI